jgi:hypothetical protein
MKYGEADPSWTKKGTVGPGEARSSQTLAEKHRPGLASGHQKTAMALGLQLGTSTDIYCLNVINGENSIAMSTESLYDNPKFLPAKPGH